MSRVEIEPGYFLMGSPLAEAGRDIDESPRHLVAIERPFAVGRFEVTFDEWEACVAGGGCASNANPDDGSWGKGRRPVINVSWDTAKEYLAWLSQRTGKPYRLLSEAEWEYVARAGTSMAYSWGNNIGKGNANCRGCGSQWDGQQTAPVGSFLPNAFGLYDMHGNVSEWVEDCWIDNYAGALADGSAWKINDCVSRTVRGRSWDDNPRDLRVASRKNFHITEFDMSNDIGFRVATTP